MNFQSHNAVLYLWCAQPVLQSVLALLLWKKKLHKKFPIFFIFLIAQIVNFSIIFPLWLSGNYMLYFAPFWLGEAVNAILGFKVIHEIFIDVFRPYHILKDLGTLLFKWAGVVMLLVSVVVAFSNSFDRSPLVHALTTLQRSVRVVQFGLILFLLLFSRFLGVSRRQISFGISLGFGLFAGTELVLYALNSGGFVNQSRLNEINMMAYIVAICVWLGYSIARDYVREAGTNRLQTERWEQGIADLHPSDVPDSLIPMFEGMVERAFSRSSSLEAPPSPFPRMSSGSPSRVNSSAAGSKHRL